MITYALRRLGFYLLAAWVAVSLNFAIPRLMPGDPAAVIFGRFQGRLAPEALDALKADAITKDLLLIRQSRLSVTPVTKEQFDRIVALSK